MKWIYYKWKLQFKDECCRSVRYPCEKAVQRLLGLQKDCVPDCTLRFLFRNRHHFSLASKLRLLCPVRPEVDSSSVDLSILVPEAFSYFDTNLIFKNTSLKNRFVCAAFWASSFFLPFFFFCHKQNTCTPCLSLHEKDYQNLESNWLSISTTGNNSFDRVLPSYIVSCEKKTSWKFLGIILTISSKPQKWKLYPGRSLFRNLLQSECCFSKLAIYCNQSVVSPSKQYIAWKKWVRVV